MNRKEGKEVFAYDENALPGYLYDPIARSCKATNVENIKVEDQGVKFEFKLLNKEYIDNHIKSSYSDYDKWVKDYKKEMVSDCVMFKGVKILEKRGVDIPGNKDAYTVTSIFYKFHLSLLLVFSQKIGQETLEKLRNYLLNVTHNSSESFIPSAVQNYFSVGYLYKGYSDKGQPFKKVKHCLEEFCHILVSSEFSKRPESMWIKPPSEMEPTSGIVEGYKRYYEEKVRQSNNGKTPEINASRSEEGIAKVHSPETRYSALTGGNGSLPSRNNTFHSPLDDNNKCEYSTPEWNIEKSCSSESKSSGHEIKCSSDTEKVPSSSSMGKGSISNCEYPQNERKSQGMPSTGGLSHSPNTLCPRITIKESGNKYTSTLHLTLLQQQDILMSGIEGRSLESMPSSDMKGNLQSSVREDKLIVNSKQNDRHIAHQSDQPIYKSSVEHYQPVGKDSVEHCASQLDQPVSNNLARNYAYQSDQQVSNNTVGHDAYQRDQLVSNNSVGHCAYQSDQPVISKSVEVSQEILEMHCQSDDGKNKFGKRKCQENHGIENSSYHESKRDRNLTISYAPDKTKKICSEPAGIKKTNENRLDYDKTSSEEIIEQGKVNSHKKETCEKGSQSNERNNGPSYNAIEEQMNTELAKLMKPTDKLQTTYQSDYCSNGVDQINTKKTSITTANDKYDNDLNANVSNYKADTSNHSIANLKGCQSSEKGKSDGNHENPLSYSNAVKGSRKVAADMKSNNKKGELKEQKSSSMTMNERKDTGKQASDKKLGSKLGPSDCRIDISGSNKTGIDDKDESSTHHEHGNHSTQMSTNESKHMGYGNSKTLSGVQAQNSRRTSARISEKQKSYSQTSSANIATKRKVKKETNTLKSKFLEPEKIMNESSGIERKVFFTNEITEPGQVILLLGASGSGKTMLINFVANFFAENKDADGNLIHVANTASTSKITAYTFCKSGDNPITIIDTPGLNDSSGAEVRDHVQALKTFLANASSNNFVIHAIGFVAQAHLVRLTSSERLVMDYVSTMFGQSISEHLISLVTFADNQDSPPVVEAMKNYGVNFKIFVKFNNSALSNTKSDEMDDLDRVYYRICWKSWKKCLKMLKELSPLSVNTMRSVQNEVYASTVIKKAEKDLHAELITFFSFCEKDSLPSREAWEICEKVWELATIVHRLRQSTSSSNAVEEIIKEFGINICRDIGISLEKYLHLLSLSPSRGLLSGACEIICVMAPVYELSTAAFGSLKMSTSIIEWSYCLVCEDEHKMERELPSKSWMSFFKKNTNLIVLKCKECKCPGETHGINEVDSPFGAKTLLKITLDRLRATNLKHSLSNSPVPEKDLFECLKQHHDGKQETKFINVLISFCNQIE